MNDIIPCCNEKIALQKKKRCVVIYEIFHPSNFYPAFPMKGCGIRNIIYLIYIIMRSNAYSKLHRSSCYWIVKIFWNSFSNISFSLAPICPNSLSFREQKRTKNKTNVKTQSKNKNKCPLFMHHVNHHNIMLIKLKSSIMSKIYVYI